MGDIRGQWLLTTSTDVLGSNAIQLRNDSNSNAVFEYAYAFSGLGVVPEPSSMVYPFFAGFFLLRRRR